MEDWWVGGLMRWGTNEMGDQWDGGPLGLADDGVTNEKRDQWDGGPMIWGTNEMGDQWAPIMYWGTNELGDQWEGDQWQGGPMTGGTSERIPAYLAFFHTVFLYLGLCNPGCLWCHLALCSKRFVKAIVQCFIAGRLSVIAGNQQRLQSTSNNSRGIAKFLDVYLLNRYCAVPATACDWDRAQNSKSVSFFVERKHPSQPIYVSNIRSWLARTYRKISNIRAPNPNT